MDFRKWRLVLVETSRDLWAASILEWSASIAFYAVLSLFPLLTALLILASYLVDGNWATTLAVEFLGKYLPGGETEIRDIVASALSERRHLGVLSIVMFMFTGRRVLGVLTKSLNHVSDVDERRDPYMRRIAVEIAMLGGLVVLGALTLALQPFIGWLWQTVEQMPGPDRLMTGIVQGFFRILLLLTGFILVYVYVPRGERLWRAAMAGAVIATLLFLLAEGVFSLVIDRVWSTLSLIYGPLALAALLLLWAWYVAVITLVGSGVASHLRVMLLEHTGIDEARGLHSGG